MSPRGCKGRWSFRVNRKTRWTLPRTAEGGRLAAMFGLHEGGGEVLYEGFRLRIEPGQIVAVVGPSGAGKSVLLREALRQAPQARELKVENVARGGRTPVDFLGGDLAEGLEMLSRCGLAEAATLITPAKLLSGGQRYRLALAEALYRAGRERRPALLVADEFAASLDFTTAANLCRNVRRVVRDGKLALLLATPRGELLEYLQPDQIVVKPLGRPAEIVGAPKPAHCNGPASFRMEPGTLRDYEELAEFHYLAGPPAAHKRVWVVPAPRRAGDWGAPRLAAVLVVSPPLASVRGRNLATGGRYAGSDRLAALELLNREMEWISRVIVHPVYRGCGLAVRLVRHALATAGTPLVESLAAMGAVNPFFERAGMRAFPLGPDEHASRLLSAAEAVGLSPREVSAVAPVKALLGRRRSRRAAFLRGEIELCIRRLLGERRADRLADPVADVCRRTARQYVYYLGERG